MTDNSPAQAAPSVDEKRIPTFSDAAAYTRHVENAYAEAAAYGHRLEQALADYQAATQRSTEHIHLLESEIARLRETIIQSQEQRPPSGYEELLTYTRHIEQAYADTTAYVRKLEKTVTEYQTVNAASSEYIAKLEAEMARIRAAYADATAYAQSLVDHNRRLGVKIDDLEENLRQYQES